MEEDEQYYAFFKLKKKEKKQNVIKMQKNSCAVYREGAIENDKMCQKWFAKFCFWNFPTEWCFTVR